MAVPRRRANYRFANIRHDTTEFAEEIKWGQFCKVYARATSRYKHHPLQRFLNLLRCFDVTPQLAAQMEQEGNRIFYQAVCKMHNAGAQFNYDADLKRINDIVGFSVSGNYLYEQLCPLKGAEVAAQAKKSYMRGFSRKVKASDYDDWEKLRSELRSGIHNGGMDWATNEQERDVLLFAVSYKGKDVKITRKMQILDQNGTPVDNAGEFYQEEQAQTADFVDDFRWSQVVRSCKTYAEKRRVSNVRIWLDRLVMMGYSPNERKEMYKVVRWEDFGLFPYAICPVVRVYDKEEKNFGTDFWRKLEAVLGVAGRGLVVDDYMLRKFDTIYYGEEIYRRLQNGLCLIGGCGEYIRSVTLAMATAVLTDGVTVTAVNEDPRTKQDIQGWKAWALRTIAEGAYSSQHAFMMMAENSFTISRRDFEVIALWESIVSRSRHLTGKSYLDMSFQRSLQWSKSGSWDGVVEWVGMVKGSCNIRQRDEIEEFLSKQVKIELYMSPTGHVASILRLASANGVHKRTLVINLTRFSTAMSGHVTAVAEATGLWGKTLLPWYLRYKTRPDLDQKVEIDPNGEILFTYEQTEIKIVWVWPLRKLIQLLTIKEIELDFCEPLQSCLEGIRNCIKWPWEDKADVGEALFDNLLMHGLYKAGIKSLYRKLKVVEYTAL